MGNLLKASFIRLKKSKIFWLLLIFSIGFALFYVGKEYSKYLEIEKAAQRIENIEYAKIFKSEVLESAITDLEVLLFKYPLIIGTIIAIFSSVFLGVEHSDGGLHRKISIGNSRTNIYLSNFIIVSIVSIIFYFLNFLVFTLAVPITGWVKFGTQELLMIVFCILLTIITYSSIFTFITMLFSNKNISVIIGIILAVLLVLAAIKSYNLANVSKYIGGATVFNEETGEEVVVIKPSLNPDYEEKSKRAPIYQVLMDINPAGQIYQIKLPDCDANLKVYPIYSICEIIIVTFSGIILFNKKELK